MAFIPFPDGAVAIIEQGNSIVQWTNTLWFHLIAGQNHDFPGLADYLHDWWAAEIMPHLATIWNLRLVTVYDMSSELGGKYTDNKAVVPGGIVQDPSPINGALVVTFYTNRRGRSGRGRNYLTGFGEEDVSANEVIDAAIVSAIQFSFQSLIADIQLNTPYYWVVASRYGLGAPRPEVEAFDVTDIEVRSAILGSQRRRIPRP